MNKTMNKIALKCILSVCLISIPFIFANYFVINYFFEHGEYFYKHDEMILNALQIILIVAAGIIIKIRSKNAISQNNNSAKKYMIGSLIAFLVIALLCITNIYSDTYYAITESLQIFDKAPLFLAVCWEQIFNGKFLLALSVCILICFCQKPNLTIARNFDSKKAFK